MKSNNEIFNNALSRFVKDFACGNEVIAKHKNKKTITTIKNELSYPISEEDIINIIWTYLIENSIILEKTPDDSINQQYEFVKKEGDFGKIYYQQIKKKRGLKDCYQLINILELKNDKNEFDKLSDFLKDLLIKLPWKNNEYYIDKTCLI